MVTIRQKNLDHKKCKDKTKTYKFQGQSARSKRWFGLDQEWLEEKFSTRKPDLYKKLYQINIKGQETKNIYSW